MCINKGSEFAAIFEIKAKRNRTKESLEELSEEAIKQIENNKYDINMKKMKVQNICKYGIAFSSTDVIVK